MSESIWREETNISLRDRAYKVIHLFAVGTKRLCFWLVNEIDYFSITLEYMSSYEKRMRTRRSRDHLIVIVKHLTYRFSCLIGCF